MNILKCYNNMRKFLGDQNDKNEKGVIGTAVHGGDGLHTMVYAFRSTVQKQRSAVKNRA